MRVPRPDLIDLIVLIVLIDLIVLIHNGSWDRFAQGTHNDLIGLIVLSHNGAVVN